jgi:2,3-bisphosphoglycerate-dependent phosphoglycerate mutase
MSTRRIVAALVRHGDYLQPEGVPSAQLPHPLTDKGIEQARLLGEQLHDECRGLGLQLDPVLDCSTLLRARQTAELAAETLNRIEADLHFSVAEFCELGERSVGAAANLTVDQIAAALRVDPRCPALPADWKSHPRFRLPVPGSESLMMAGARVAAHIERRAHELRYSQQLGRGGSGHDVLKVVVGHGGALRHAAVCMGALELLEVTQLSMHHCGYVLVEHIPDPTRGPGRWQKVGGRWKVRSSATD